MEHPCYRCQALIEEGIAFCPHCGAPQIRVVAPEENGAAMPPLSPGAPVELSAPVPPAPWPSGTIPYHPTGGIQWELAWPGALLAGAGAAVLTAIPFVSLGCCLWMLGAGALAAALYQRRVPGLTMTPGMGMKVGALAGVFGFVINAAITTLSFLAFRSAGSLRRAMQDQMEKQMANSPDPKAQEIMQRMVDWMSTPQGAATLMVLVLLVLAIVFLLFTAAGGALGASMVGKKREFH